MTSYAIVTGASKGIGKSFSEILASKGYNLVLIARSESLLKDLSQELEKKYSIKTETIGIDLSEKESPQKVFDYCQNRNLPIDILINNAGYGLFGRFDSSILDNQLNMLNLNILSLVALTHLFIPLLKKQGKAYILNVASTAAYQAVPELSTYSASKAFVLSFSRAIAFELKNTDISVTCLSPGSTNTSFMDRAGMTNPKILATAAKLGMNADEVAKQGLEAMFKGEAEYIPGFVNTLGATLNRFFPKKFVENIAASLYKE